MTGPDELDEAATPGPRWGRVVAFALGLGGVLAAVSLVAQAVEPHCRDLPREDLSLAELGQLRRLVDHYKSDPESPLRLTPRQTSFLLREEFDLPVWINVADGELTFESRVPRFGRCWSVSFDGEMTVQDGVALVSPRHLVVGHLSLTPAVRGASWKVIPAQLQLPRARELLTHIREAHVEGDVVVVSVDDPGWLR